MFMASKEHQRQVNYKQIEKLMQQFPVMQQRTNT